MFRRLAITIMLVSAWPVAGPRAEETEAGLQHAVLKLENPPVARFEHTRHPDAQWFGKNQFGLFIHWGISSVMANNEISWAMLKNTGWNHHPTSPTLYWAQAEDFNPQAYDPDKWMRAAAAAGFTYAVLTTRHHDGYAMWPSAVGEINTSMTMGERDLIWEYVTACRNHGLKVGLYFSGGNWHIERDYRSFDLKADGSPEKPFLDVNYEPVELPGGQQYQYPPGFVEDYKAFNAAQLKELLTNYGPIDIIWFDSGFSGLTVEQVRAWQPGIIINNRVTDLPPDYDSSYEGRLPEKRPAGWWEACMTANPGWGYRTSHEKHVRSAADVLSTLIKIGSWDGNFLINHAPRASGEMPDLYYNHMSELAAWMEDNRETIIGTRGGVYPEQCNVPVTTRGQIWYLHALPEWNGETIVLAGVPEPTSVALHATGERLATAFDATRLEIKLPAALRTGMPDVVRVEW